MEIFILCAVLGGLFTAEKGARQTVKQMKAFGRKASGKNRRARKKREAKKRSEEPGFFASMGKRAAGIEDTSSLRGQIAQLKRQLAECRRENEVLHHRLEDLRNAAHDLYTDPIHIDCDHQHCLDYKELIYSLNRRSYSAASHRWMTKR